MSSTKFSSRPPARKRPIICKAGPGPASSAFEDDPAIEVTAFVQALDLDPVAWFQIQATFQLQWFPAKNHFFGRSAPSGDRVELWLIPAAVPNTWAAQLDLWDPIRVPETWYYSNIVIPVDLPWGTPNFGDVVLSGRDFRAIQVKE